MPGASERLKLFKVTSVVEPGAYDEAMKGCSQTLAGGESRGFAVAGGEPLAELRPKLPGTMDFRVPQQVDEESQAVCTDVQGVF